MSVSEDVMKHFPRVGMIAAMLLLISACVPEETLQSGVDAGSKQYAEVYVYRPDLGIKGGIDLQTVVLVDDRNAGVIDNGEYVHLFLKPGKYQLAIRADENVRKDVTTLHLANHDVRYFEVRANPKRMVTAIAIPFGDIVTSKAFLLQERNRKDFEKAAANLKDVTGRHEIEGN